MSKPIKLCIAGICGRMGQELFASARAAKTAQGDAIEVTAVVESENHPAIGKDVGELARVGACGVTVGTTVTDGDFDLLVEFTTPAATLAHLDDCVKLNRAMVIGTTGLDDAGKKRIVNAAKKIPIVFSANTSVGINLCAVFLEIAGEVMQKMDIEIIEAHHRDKVDAPSGTALLLGEAVTKYNPCDIKKDRVFSRHERNGPRKDNEIGFASIRAGDIVGEHSVWLVGDYERIELTHHVTNRRIFAEGAVRAILWLAGKEPGLYDMRDVLGLKDVRA